MRFGHSNTSLLQCYLRRLWRDRIFLESSPPRPHPVACRAASRHALKKRYLFERRNLRRGVDPPQLTFGGRDVSFAKSPLTAFFEGRNNIAARKFVDGVGTEVEQKRDLAGIQQNIVFIGHISPTRRLSFRDFVRTRFCSMRPTMMSR